MPRLLPATLPLLCLSFLWLSFLWLFLFGHAATAATIPVPLPGTLKDSPAPPPPAAVRPKPARLPDAPVTMPRRGEKDAYGVVTDQYLEAVYDGWMKGDGEAALAALKQAKADTPLARWHRSTLRLQLLLGMGRAADAERELEKNAELERARFGGDGHARALSAEIRTWLGDLEGAAADAGAVIGAYADWRLPTHYAGPPANLTEIVHATTTQLRAMTALAVVRLLQGEFAAAQAWAADAEGRYADVHYVAGHPLYGALLGVHADSYHGRATNLAVFGAAALGAGASQEEAEPWLTAARSFFAAVGDRAGEVTTAILETYALERAGRFAEVEKVAARAAETAAEQGLGDLLWRIELLRGRALSGAGRRQEAEAAYRRAQVAVEQVSGSLSSDHAKRRFGVGKEELRHTLAAIDADKGDLPALFADLERGRARAFIDMLAQRPLALARQPELGEAIRRLDGEIRTLRLKLAAPQGAGREIADRLEQLLERRRERVAGLHRKDPELADLLAVATLGMEEARARLAPGQYLLYPLPSRSGESLRLLELRRDGERLVTLGLRQEELHELLAGFGKAIEALDFPRQEKLAHHLSQRLELERWGDAAGIYLVPDGDWHLIPWGALELHAPLAVLPAAGWLARSPQAVGGGEVVVVGDPDYGGALEQLPGARAEARAVAGLYGAEPLLGRAASVAGLRKRVGGGAEVIHLATHGRFDARDPLASSLYFSGKKGPEALTAAELFARPLAARLVVLSGCETGLGRVEAGADFLGLPRSFYLGGSLALLSSLWPVDDEGTRRFMETFHRLAKGGEYGKAWLAARDRLRKEGMPPFVYGGFVLGGSLGG